MDIRSFSSSVGNAGTGATDLIALWTSSTVIGANANFAYDGTTFKLALDMRMNEAGTAAAQAVIRQRANTGSVAIWGASTATGAYLELFGNTHATKANLIEIGAGVTSITIDAANGIFKAGAGASTTPSYTSGAFPTTGLYFAAGPVLGFATGGTSAGTINASQKWAIGIAGNTQFHDVFGRGFNITSAANVIGYVFLNSTSNTSGAGAAFDATVAGSSAGDAFSSYSVSGGVVWVAGLDNSVSGDPYVISASAALGGSNVLVLTTAGLGTLTGQLGVGATAVTSKGINLTLTAAQMAGGTQYGVFTSVTCSSAATTGFSGYQCGLTTAAAAFTCPYVIGVEIGGHAAGSGSTITRAVSYLGSVQTVGGTGNAWGCDNIAFTGNFVLNFSSTNASSFAGQVRVASLGVGNSAAATTPGAVQAKVEVFNASGVSLGFAALYDAIT